MLAYKSFDSQRFDFNIDEEPAVSFHERRRQRDARFLLSKSDNTSDDAVNEADPK